MLCDSNSLPVANLVLFLARGNIDFLIYSRRLYSRLLQKAQTMKKPFYNLSQPLRPLSTYHQLRIVNKPHTDFLFLHQAQLTYYFRFFQKLEDLVTHDKILNKLYGNIPALILRSL